MNVYQVIQVVLKRMSPLFSIGVLVRIASNEIELHVLGLASSVLTVDPTLKKFVLMTIMSTVITESS